MTKHKADCKMSFGRKDESCPRCQELLNGAPTRDGWQKSYYAHKAQQEQLQTLAHAAHFAPNGPHASGKCGPVCTFGDW